MKHPAVDKGVKRIGFENSNQYTSWSILVIIALVFTLVSLSVILPLVLIKDNEDGHNHTNSVVAIEYISKPTPSVISSVVSESPMSTVVSVGIELDTYSQLINPIIKGFHIFKNDPSIIGCPFANGGLTVLFSHTECQPLCNNLQNCIGYNFDTITHTCLFFTNIICIQNIDHDMFDITEAYVKNR